MKKSIIYLAVCLAFSSVACQQRDEIDIKVQDLLSRMTLEEKVGQMTQVNVDRLVKPDSKIIDTVLLRQAIVGYHVGSALNTPMGCAQPAEWWNEYIGYIQELAVNETRLGIPVIYGLDQVHGGTYTLGSTLFPQEIGLAATWNPSFARRMGEITAYEMRAADVPWNFAPILDLGPDPRFPRQYEGFGEDPLLSTKMGVELVNGLEGDDNDVDNPYHVAGCLKHFLGYGVPNSGKDRTPANIPWNAILEYHAPSFRAAIDAGAKSIMINSGIIDNEPVHASYKIMTEFLRNELGFKGMVVTDWEDINKLHVRDHLVPSIREAIKVGINAGIDMVMVPNAYEQFCTELVALVNDGEVSMKRIDEAVGRVLRLKFELGLFDTPDTKLEDYPDFACEAFRKASYEAASESITLLKNDRALLPLNPAANSRILVCGPNAQSRRAVCGGWSITWQGHGMERYPELCKTFAEAAQSTFRNVKVLPGVSYDNAVMEYETEHADRYAETIAAARNSDIILLFIGENSYCEKPGDLNDLAIDELQSRLAKDLIATGKPVVAILNEGRPRLISGFSDGLAAIVQTYLPGPQGPDALMDVLVGKVNPSGRLPYTYPAFANSLLPYWHKYSDEQKNNDDTYKYEGDFNPEFHFGFGLSYTTFEYSNASISVGELPCSSDNEIVVGVDVTNTGKMTGKEVVQLYSSDLYASLIPDIKRLRAFEKIELRPGETRRVEFVLTPSDLAFYNLENELIVEAGDFLLSVGSSSKDIKAVLNFKLL